MIPVSFLPRMPQLNTECAPVVSCINTNGNIHLARELRDGETQETFTCAYSP